MAVGLADADKTLINKGFRGVGIFEGFDECRF